MRGARGGTRRLVRPHTLDRPPCWPPILQPRLGPQPAAPAGARLALARPEPGRRAGARECHQCLHRIDRPQSAWGGWECTQGGAGERVVGGGAGAGWPAAQRPSVSAPPRPPPAAAVFKWWRQRPVQAQHTATPERLLHLCEEDGEHEGHDELQRARRLHHHHCRDSRQGSRAEGGFDSGGTLGNPGACACVPGGRGAQAARSRGCRECSQGKLRPLPAPQPAPLPPAPPVVVIVMRVLPPRKAAAPAGRGTPRKLAGAVRRARQGEGAANQSGLAAPCNPT